MSEYPVQAQYLVDKFNTDDFVLKTFINNNVDNVWMLRQNDVVLLVDEGRRELTLQLGGTSHAERQTGLVKSSEVSVSYHRNSTNVGEINKSKRDSLQDVFDSESDDLYTAFVSAFGSDTIISDDR